MSVMRALFLTNPSPAGAAAVALWLALSTAAQAQRVDPARSELVFVTRQMGVPVEGRFERWDAQLAFDPRKPESASLVLRIDIGSLSFAASEVSTEAQRGVWFDAARFPQAGFRSTTVKALGPGRYEMAGRLDLKGHTRELVVPVELVQTGSTGTASGSFTVDRMAFRIGDAEWADPSLVAHEVRVRFKIALTGLAAP
jgi:polyisoprenoid-binding protein YceI